MHTATLRAEHCDDAFGPTARRANEATIVALVLVGRPNRTDILEEKLISAACRVGRREVHEGVALAWPSAILRFALRQNTKHQIVFPRLPLKGVTEWARSPSKSATRLFASNRIDDDSRRALRALPLVLGIIPQIAAREISKSFEDARADVVAVASRLPRIIHSRVRK